MKIVLQIFIILLIFGCTNINNVTQNTPLVDIVVQQDKYSLILKHHFYKNFKNYDKNLAQITVKTNLTFASSNALSNNGDGNLTVIVGKVNFKIFNISNTEIIKIGSVSSSVTTGGASSLYSIDENNNFVKERISKNLAYKLYREILLNINYSEN